jgi:hypothetical protein
LNFIKCLTIKIALPFLKAQLEEARHNEKMGLFTFVIGGIGVGIGAWIGLGSTATENFANGGYI